MLMKEGEDVDGVGCLIVFVHDIEWGDHELADRFAEVPANRPWDVRRAQIGEVG